MDALRRELESFVENNGFSYSKVAKAMSIGTSTLSEFRKGTYKGDMDALADKVRGFLDRHKTTMKRIKFSADTEVKKRVFYTIDMIQKYVASNVKERLLESAKIAYIFGRAGIGKTHALQEYVKSYKGRCIFITAENNITDTTLIRKIARELKLDYQGKKENLKEDIKDMLKFTETILIIDEGEHLKPKVIDIVRSIADQTGIGVVIAGTEKLKQQICSQRGEYEYLYSRAVINMTLKDLDIKDIRLIVTKFLGSEVDLYEDKEITEMINYINLTVKGSARQLSNLLSLASDIASRPENFEDTKGRITIEYIKAAITMLSIM